VSEEADETLVRPAASAGPEAATSEPLSEPLFAGRYALVKLLGRGGMGTVYQARDVLVGDVVALKKLELGKDAGPDAIERFRREVRLARRIAHPCVARTHDLGTHEGQPFLTMEYVEGEDLRALLARERGLPAARAARIALAVAEGLAAAHAAGVVHRDLKPANILLEPGGRVVLTDFGIARAVVAEASSRTLGGVVGTPLYMAPEQVSGEPVDARADLYAVGLLLYELLTGELPFSGDSPWAAALARLRQAPPDPRQRANVPAPLAELALRCLARAPEDRPATALEVASSLREWLASVGESTGGIPLSTVLGTVPPSPTPAPGASPTPLQTLRSVSMTPRQGVGLLPLRFQGPREAEFLGDSLTEALIDTLSRVRGLSVMGSGVMARFRQERDPRVVGRELGLELVVDGTVQSTGTSVRVSLRLLECGTGTQLWSGRFEHGSTDAFELQDRLVPRLAEALREELVLAAWRANTPPEALVLYRQAEAQLTAVGRVIPETSLQLLEECLALAPNLLPALALHAIANLRMWFVATRDSQQDWAAAARASVERAVRLAPELPNSHLARAMLAAQDDDWRAAVMALRTALDLAPTHAGSLLYLGTLQCEAGRADEGLMRLRLAHELSPGQSSALFELARCSALRGRMEDYRWALEKMSGSAMNRMGLLSLRSRVAAWTGDREELLRCRQALMDETVPMAQASLGYVNVVLGEMKAEEMQAFIDGWLARAASVRMASMVCQLTTEVLCLIGQPELALPYFNRAVDTALIDLEWMDRCPALQSLRPLPAFTEGRRKVRARVEALWTV
jgi:serine/threonine-protein kinase